MKHYVVAFACCTVLVARIPAQTTLLVPSQYSTIQAAIVASVNGDDVLVAPGTYPGAIDFLGKAIVVHSSGGAGVTAITGTSAGRVVTFSTGEGPTSVLDGMTIKSGNGGILCQDTSPVIQNCRIVNNLATIDGGGGIRCSVSPSGTCSPIVQNCTISNNSTNSSQGGGGGIRLDGPSTSPSLLTLDNCVISSNIAFGGGGGIMNNSGPDVVLTGCKVEGNVCMGFGGGIQTYSPLTLTSTSVTDNHCTGPGGAIYTSFATTSLTGCVIARNFSGNGAGGVQCSLSGAVSPATLTIRNCTIAANAGGSVTGGVDVFLFQGVPSTVTITSSIIWGNSGLDLTTGVASVTYSDVGIGFYPAGAGTLSLDPLFIDSPAGDYHLGSSSPCRDSGAPGTAGLPPTDFDGTPRVAGSFVDIGTDELPLLSYPGTADGLDIYATVNGAGDPLASTRPAVVGELLEFRISSSSGTLAGGLPLFLARLYTVASPPTQPLPWIWVDGASIVVYGVLAAPPFGFPGLPAEGLDFTFVVPPGLAGSIVRMQAVVTSPNALNGTYAASNATDVSF